MASIIQWGNVAWVLGAAVVVIGGLLLVSSVLEGFSSRSLDRQARMTREERRAEYRSSRRQRPLP
jgi:uncharacterized membrane protein